MENTLTTFGLAPRLKPWVPSSFILGFDPDNESVYFVLTLEYVGIECIAT